jgi:hypothetical protein
MDVNSLLREIELKEEGIENLLGERENYECDIFEEGISVLTRRMIQNKIDTIDFTIWTLRTRIRVIETKLKRGGYIE